EAPPYDLFTRMLQAAFVSLNISRPNLTKSCWLCYDTRPPFYEVVGLTTQFSYSKESSPKQCKWNTHRRGITLEMVSGQGTCIG
ncbi:ENV2 protein, partial [Certhia brachydactyla]|nr:ENV2 protein [Certhia brachydactyla]